MSKTGIFLDKKEVDKYFKKVKNNQTTKRNVLKKIGVEGQNDLKEKAQKITATGHLESSIDHVIRRDEVEVRANEKYALIALEKGRKPGKQPPLRAMEIYARKRGIPVERAFIMARHIGKYGTSKWRKGGPKLLTGTKNVVEKSIPKYLKQLLRFYD